MSEFNPRDGWRRVNEFLAALRTYSVVNAAARRGSFLIADEVRDFDPIARAAEQRLCGDDAFTCFAAAPDDFLSKTIH